MPHHCSAPSPQGSPTCLALGHIEEPASHAAAPRPSRTPEHPRLRLPPLLRPPLASSRAAAPSVDDARARDPGDDLHLRLVPPRIDHDELPPGTCLGRHVVLRARGEGGTCRIYDAQHVQNGHRVIARLPRREVLRAHAWIADRMLANAALLADAPHPGVLAVFDFGWTDEAEPRPFMITERIVGQDLAIVLEERGPLPSRQVVDLALEIAAALSHFHDLGVVHGDLKPSNIMLVAGDEPRGRIKIIDPDLARRFDAPPDPGLSPGTPSYLAPEHVYGLRPSVKSDLFSLGVILYELLVGHCPIPGERRLRALQAGASWPQLPALHLAYPDLGVPVTLSRLICRLTSHDRGTRPGAASQVVAELELIRDGGGVAVSQDRVQAAASRPAAAGASAARSRAIPKDLSPQTGSTTSPDDAPPPRSVGAWEPAGRPALMTSRPSGTPWAFAVAAVAAGLLGLAVLIPTRAPIGADAREPARAAAVNRADEPTPPAASPTLAPPLTPESASVVATRDEPPSEPTTTATPDARRIAVDVDQRAPASEKPRGARQKRRPPRSPKPADAEGSPELPAVDDTDDRDATAELDDEGEASILAFREAARAFSRSEEPTPAPSGEAVLLPIPGAAARDPEHLVVPGVTDRPIAEAERRLALAGITVTSRRIIRATCEGEPAGTVIAQDPGPGSRFHADLPVILRVCEGGASE